MDTDCSPRSSLSSQLNLNLHYRHPHHASINARTQSLQSIQNPHNVRALQTARRQHLRGAALEYRHHHAVLARETSDGSSADRLTRVTKTTTTTAAASPPAFSSPTGAPIQADLWPGNRQQLAGGSSINSQHHNRSLPKQTLLRQQHFHQQQLPVSNTSINVSSSSISSAPHFINNASVTRHDNLPTHRQQQIQSPTRGQHHHRLPHDERPFSEPDRLPLLSSFSLSHFSHHQTAVIEAQANEMAESNFETAATTQPASPGLPSPVPTLSSSPGESAATSHAPSDQNCGSLSGATEKGRRENSKSPTSTQSQGTSNDGNSVRGFGGENTVKSGLPELASGTTQSTFQNVTAPFHFPMSRRSSTASSLVNNSSPPQQGQQIQTAQPAQPAHAAQPTQQTQSALDNGASYGNYFAYCLDRGNGLYTRLIPADLLPPTAGFLALQNDNRGMIVLPDPSTQSAPAMMPAVHTNSNPSGYATQPAQQNFAQFGAMQGQPPSTVASLAQRPGLPGNSAKKHKVYCDKWVHEGICAFTQQGCKFKHEMPHDRATQRSLGLFQGYPNWYKKLQAQEQQQHHQHHHQQSFGSQMMTAPAMAPLALPAPAPHNQESGSTQLQTLPTGLPYPIPSSSCVPAPPPPPPTPSSHLATTAPHQQPFFSPFGSPTSNRHRVGVTPANTSTSMEGQWRTNVLNAASWRAAPTSTTSVTGDITGTTLSADHLMDNFARSLTLDSVNAAYQLQLQQQQQPQQAPALTTTANPSMGSGLPGTTAFSSFGYGLGGFGGGFGLGHQLDSALDEGNTNSSFGPIGPPAATAANFVPSGVTSPATAGFNYRAIQEPSQQFQSSGRSSSWPEDEGGHLATTQW